MCIRDRYQASFGSLGAENELCWVYVGRTDSNAEFNQNEISQIRWINIETLENELANHGDKYSPWFQLEWAEIRRKHWPVIEGLA